MNIPKENFSDDIHFRNFTERGKKKKNYLSAAARLTYRETMSLEQAVMQAIPLHEFAIREWRQANINARRFPVCQPISPGVGG